MSESDPGTAAGSTTDAGRDSEAPRVAIIGGGVAGSTAGTFCARAGFDTVVVDGGESILRRNAHLENFPGFPAGVNSRTLLELLFSQAGRNGCQFEDGRVTNLVTTGEDFRLEIDAPDGESELRADYVIATSWPDAGYLPGAVSVTERGSKTYVDVDDFGRTTVDGLYAAGRIAGKPHQAIVAAGHGAEVALALVDDSDVPFYHDWVAPAGYFTERGRDVPPGVEEIEESERKRRERDSMATIMDAFEEAHPGEPTMHPSVVESRKNSER